MSNHLHLVWQVCDGHRREEVQRDLLRFTSQQIQKELRNNDARLHKQFEVNLKDRKYQIWQRNALIETFRQVDQDKNGPLTSPISQQNKDGCI